MKKRYEELKDELKSLVKKLYVIKFDLCMLESDL